MAASMTSIAKPVEDQGSFFTRMPWYYQMALLLLLVALLIYASHQMLYSETRAETAKIHEQVQKLMTQNAQGSIVRQNLAATEETLKQKRAEMDGLRELLPDSVEISRVFDNIKDFVRGQKLELKRFMHLKSSPADIYTAQPIEVEVTGTYDNLGQFFSQVGFYKRIVSVNDVDVKQAEDSAQEQGRTINASFIVTAYYLAPENLEKLTAQGPEAPSAPATPAKDTKKK